MKPHLRANAAQIQKVASVILAGGEGTRLYPLTLSKCKPDVTFGGKYRLIDVPISNSLNSRIPNIFIISQYFATSLNQHILNTFHDHHKGRIECLSPEETRDTTLWYKGTADAVRKNLSKLLEEPYEYFFILSGDQLYNMDLTQMLEFAIEKEADLTIATLPVDKKEAERFGIMRIGKNAEILDFYEKPKDPIIQKNYHLSKEFIKKKGLTHLKPPLFLASMGIYIFKREALKKILTEFDGMDFGKDLIPAQIKNLGKTVAYVYDGYWEDIGTISSFYKANLDLISKNSALNLYDENKPIYGPFHNLPSPYISKAKVSDSIISDGCVIHAQEITHSMIGVRTHILEGTIVRDSIILGNQKFLDPGKKTPYQIGKHCLIEKAIIDENVTIGDHVRLVNQNNLKDFNGEGFFIRDGIIIVPSGAAIPDHFTL